MIYFGTAGWAYDDWYGAVYPAKKPKDFNQLEFLVRFVDCLEINSTFYFPPSLSSATNWARIASGKKDFLFTVKLWEKFTHKNSATEDDAAIFKNSISPLQNAGLIGALLIQFPWSYSYNKDHLSYVESTCLTFADYSPCVELRHKSWLNQSVEESFRTKGVSFVNIDEPVTKESISGTAYSTGKTGYFRFHGRNYEKWFSKNSERHERYDYLYTNSELEEFANGIKTVAAKTDRTFVITNNHFRGSAFKNSLELKNIVTKEKVVLPATCLAKFPDLKKIAQKIDNAYSPAQGDLFGNV
jgi:uncharacterized protein YecE (DUF72 family)